MVLVVTLLVDDAVWVVDEEVQVAAPSGLDPLQLAPVVFLLSLVPVALALAVIHTLPSLPIRLVLVVVVALAAVDPVVVVLVAPFLLTMGIVHHTIEVQLGLNSVSTLLMLIWLLTRILVPLLHGMLLVLTTALLMMLIPLSPATPASNSTISSTTSTKLILPAGQQATTKSNSCGTSSIIDS
jgi:hypothetical protein